ncbi:phage/plasmid replication domain-containing protein [Acinetobacter baumannii]|nr:phage/plasmid replication protein [Acinetobacter baumannii]
MLKYGIDISTKSPKEKNNVIPLIRVLEAKPVGIPDWAYERNLVA